MSTKKKIMNRSMLPSIGDLWVHTDKAVRRGAPSTMIFLVSADGFSENEGEEGRQRQGWIEAWKCEMSTDRGLKHPGGELIDDYWLYVPFSDSKLRKAAAMQSDSGAEPTALFRPDSFYKKVTIEELKNITRMRLKIRDKHNDSKINAAMTWIDRKHNVQNWLQDPKTRTKAIAKLRVVADTLEQIK